MKNNTKDTVGVITKSILLSSLGESTFLFYANQISLQKLRKRNMNQVYLEHPRDRERQPGGISEYSLPVKFWNPLKPDIQVRSRYMDLILPFLLAKYKALCQGAFN